MEFENINDWLEFIKKTSIDQLIKILSEDFSLDDKLKNAEIFQLDNRSLTIIHEKLIGFKCEEVFWENTLYFININSLEDSLIEYLIDNGIAISTLAHMPLSDKHLWRLVDKEDEAIITLGKRYYTENKYTNEDFEIFLEKFNSKHWLFNNLLSIDNAPQCTKRKNLIKILFLSTEFEDLKRSVIEKNIEKTLIKTKKVELIHKYYKTNNYRFLRAIAQNDVTPKDILNELINVKNVKFANQIRQFANDNLKKT